MAEDIVIGVEVDPSGKGAKSLKSLKDDTRLLQKELEKTTVGTKEYQQALERLGAVKDEIGDLRDTISALNPEGKVQAFSNVAGKLAGGFQAATGAAALFGAQSEELEKQLLKVQAATALAQGIQSVAGLSDAFNVLKASLLSLNPVLLIISASVAAIAAIYLVWSNNMSEAAKNDALLNHELERQKRNQEGINDEISRELALKKELGLANSELTKFELDAEIKRYAALRTRQLLLQQVIDKSDEQREELKKLNKEEADSYNQILILKIRGGHQVVEERKKENDAKKEILKEELKDDYDQRMAAIWKQWEDEKKAKEQIENEKRQAVIDSRSYEQSQILAGIDEMDAKDAERRKAEADKDKKDADDKKAAADKKKADDIKMEQAYFSAVSDLSAVYFNGQLAAAKGNAEKENKIRKKQFEVDKALRATQATIDTLRGVAAAAPNIPLQIAVGVSGAALVAKILTTQYNQPSTNFSSDVSSNAPQIQTQAPVTTTSTRLNEQGQNLSMKDQRVYLVESDVTESQGRVARLQEQSTF